MSHTVPGEPALVLRSNYLRIRSLLLVAVIILVLVFQSSDNLGAAYGIAVSGMMAITTGLAFLYMRSQGWRLSVAVPLFAFFGMIDLTFLTANMLKIAEGGWFPVVVAGLVFAEIEHVEHGLLGKELEAAQAKQFADLKAKQLGAIKDPNQIKQELARERAAATQPAGSTQPASQPAK